MSLNEFRSAMEIKSMILAEGIKIDDSLANINHYNHKKYHLYDHSLETNKYKVPDDIILYNDSFTNKPIIVRNRLNSNSSWILKLIGDKVMLVGPDTVQEVTFPTPPKFDGMSVNNEPLAKVVTKLGTDLCGVILSNNCFYFGSKKECKFCEILPTYLEYKSYPQATKRTEHVIEAFNKAILSDLDYEHIVLTTGNIRDYDYTCELFEEIGYGIKALKKGRNLEITATLMPPTDFMYIDRLKDSGYDRIYFDLELFDRELFEIITPGKADYGYDKLIEALQYAVRVFGKGKVFTNLVYGIQSLPTNLNTDNIDFKLENKISMEAVNSLLEIDVVPVFTVYHSSGRNEIGPITLDGQKMYEFFDEYGEAVFNSGIIPKDSKAMIFSVGSTTNTIYNDAYALAALKSASREMIEMEG